MILKFSLPRFLCFFCLLGVFIGHSSRALDTNSSQKKIEIIRVIQPGVFDLQSSDYLVRMRAWGVSFPTRGQPGYEAALAFTEKKLISIIPDITVKREFDDLNFKVVDVELAGGSTSFSKDAITFGVGWHNEVETNRYGPFLMAQLKAKRMKTGIWGTEFDYNISSLPQKPKPQLPTLFNQRQNFIPSISFWVTSFGKIHRPECSFYERGRGTLSTKPKGSDCRICGGRKLRSR